MCSLTPHLKTETFMEIMKAGPYIIYFKRIIKKKKTKQGIVARYSKSVFQTKISLVKIDAVYKVI